MIQRTNKNEIRGRIHKRIRSKVRGTPERPRLAIFRSLSHIYAQLIDDTKSQTLVAAASSEKTLLNGAASVSAPAPIVKAEAPKIDKGGKGEKGEKGDKGEKGEKKVKKAAAPIAKARGGNVPRPPRIGKTIADRANENGVKRDVVDRRA